jgi:hypothetical protein
MRHEAGMHRLWKCMDMEWLTTKAIKQNKMGEIIEQDKQMYVRGQRRFYAGHPRDVISNEIFRRIHPEGLTYGEFLRQVICPLIGSEGELIMGATEEEVKLIQPTKFQSNWY